MNYELAEREVKVLTRADRPLAGDDVYLVECTWCGAKIRENEEDTTGVCLKCFYQMLTNHLESQKQAAYGDFVSDR